MWDGFLYLYNVGPEEWANRTMRGRIACQVKGTDTYTTGNTETFSVELCDLENYLRDGGVLFFLVHTLQDAQPAFWALLTPVDIRGYLDKAKGQKYTTINLESVPVSTTAYEQAVLDFYEHCQLQRKPPVDITAIADSKQFKTLVKVEPGESPILAMTKGFQYLYSCDSDGGFGNPIGDTKFTIRVSQKISESFYVGEEEFKVPVELRYMDGSATLLFGNFMKMDVKRNDNRPCQLNYNADRLLGVRERSIALGVLLAMDASDTVRIGDWNLSCAEVVLQTIERDSILAELKNSKKVVALLDLLHIKDDLSLDSLSKHDKDELNTLYKAVFENKNVTPVSNKNDIQISNVKIGQLKIKVWLVKEGDSYKVYDLFGQNYVIGVAEGDEEQKHEVGRFVLLNVNDYVHVSNIDWALIPSDYARIYKGDPVTLHYANQDSLNMLVAYDKCGKADLLNAAFRLTDWLVKVCDTDEKVIYRVNQLQTIKRMRDLEEAEIGELISFYEHSEASPELKYCCALLLGEIKRAEYHFKTLSREMRDFYKTLPINRFYVSSKG